MYQNMSNSVKCRIFTLIRARLFGFWTFVDRSHISIYWSISDTPQEDNGVCWEYKWDQKEDSKIHGPFSSEEMAEWVEDNYFPEGVFVRKAGVLEAAFYSSKRVDFELYTWLFFVQFFKCIYLLFVIYFHWN